MVLLAIAFGLLYKNYSRKLAVESKPTFAHARLGSTDADTENPILLELSSTSHRDMQNRDLQRKSAFSIRSSYFEDDDVAYSKVARDED